MKAFKLFVSLIVILAMSASCSREDGVISNPIEEVELFTFVVELEENENTFQIGVDYTDLLRMQFVDGIIEFDLKRTITANIPEKYIERFLWVMTNSKYVVSVTEIYENNSRK